MDYHVYKLDDIPHKIREERGIYSFYLNLNSINKGIIENYHRAFFSKDFKSIVKGNFSESYNGELMPEFGLTEKIQNSLKSAELTELATIAFSSPIYIGKSNDLKKRLQEHLDYYSQSHDFSRTPNYHEKLGTGDFFDKKIESNVFGWRLAKLNEKGWFNENNLHVKILYLEKYELDEVNNLERFLNLTYRPILGIR